MKLEDLLITEATSKVEIDVKNYIKGEVVLITGAAGSIGSELSKMIAHNCSCKLILLDNNEYGLYTLETELTSTKNVSIEFVLGTICDAKKMDVLFQKYHPTIVYHIAAYKHVPLMEKHPYEAIKINVIGTQILANTAKKYQVKNFIFVSTDKAVKPSSIMGATKRIGELYVASLNKSEETTFKIVRFGNIPYSSGSVIPLFKKQLKQGGPITITSKESTRYFITIDKVCNSLLTILVLQKGNLILCEMGEPVNIYELAKTILNNSKSKDAKEIVFNDVGLRPGEKLHEVLNYENEVACENSNSLLRIFVMQQTSVDIFTHIETLKSISPETKKATIVQLLQNTIPEFNPASVDIN